MLITKTNPKGIDWYIQRLQTKLHSELNALWGTPEYKCYGRCYRNSTADGYTAEVFTGGSDYEEVYWDDSLGAISFFGVGETFEVDTLNTANVHLVFFVNVAKLKTSISHRADEEVRADVQSVVGKSSFGFSLESIELWLDNVLRDYPGSRRDDRLKYVDMQPVHCFRLNFSIKYEANKNC